MCYIAAAVVSYEKNRSYVRRGFVYDPLNFFSETRKKRVSRGRLGSAERDGAPAKPTRIVLVR